MIDPRWGGGLPNAAPQRDGGGMGPCGPPQAPAVMVVGPVRNPLQCVWGGAESFKETSSDSLDGQFPISVCLSVFPFGVRGEEFSQPSLNEVSMPVLISCG